MAIRPEGPARQSSPAPRLVASTWAFASALAGNDEVAGRVTLAVVRGRAPGGGLDALAAVTQHPWGREPLPDPDTLRDAFRALEPRLRAGVWAREVERLPSADIASVLGVDDRQVLTAAIGLALIASSESSIAGGRVGASLIELASPLPHVLVRRLPGPQLPSGRPMVPLVGAAVVSVAVAAASLTGFLDGRTPRDAAVGPRSASVPADPTSPASGEFLLGLHGTFDQGAPAPVVPVELAVARAPLPFAPVRTVPSLEVTPPTPPTPAAPAAPVAAPAPAPAAATASEEPLLEPAPELEAAATSETSEPPASPPEPPAPEPGPAPPEPEPEPEPERPVPNPDPPLPEPDPAPVVQAVEEVTEDVAEVVEAVVEVVPAPVTPPELP